MSVYNGEAHLPAAVESIVGQTFNNWEFVIVDDGSTDRSPEILRKYAGKDDRIRVVRNDGNLGLTKSLNWGIDLAQGDYIARQDADDMSLPLRLAEQVAFMRHNPDIGVLATWVAARNECDDLTDEWRSPVSPGSVKWNLLFGNCLAHSSVMIRRKLLTPDSRYDETIRFAQDFDLWMRLSRCTHIASIPKVLCHRRVHHRMIGQRFGDHQEQTVISILQTAIGDLLDEIPTKREVRALRLVERGQTLHSSDELRTVVELVERMFHRFVSQSALSPHDRGEIARSYGRRCGRFAMRHYRLAPLLATHLAIRALRYNPFLVFCLPRSMQCLRPFGRHLRPLSGRNAK